MRYFLFFFIFYLLSPTLSLLLSQNDSAKISDSPYFVVKNIEITGNKRTKEFVFRKEMTFWIGDTLAKGKLWDILDLNEKKLINSALFTEVLITTDSTNRDSINIYINVRERWYIFPSPQFSLVDRNFNEWWTTYDHDLRRTIYGGSLYIDNVRGRDERFNTTILAGFKQHLAIDYEVPYLGLKSNIGARIGARYLRSRDITLDTENNKLVSLHSDEYVRQLFNIHLSLRYKTNHFVHHLMHIDFNQTSIHDTVGFINEDFFLEGKTHQRYIQIAYEIRDDHRDIAAYPLEGYSLNFLVVKRGLGIFDDLNMLVFRSNVTKYFKISPKFYSSHALRGKVSFPRVQPYFNQVGLGFSGDLVRGYELYVIDAQHFVLNRNTLKYKLVNFTIESKLIPLKQFRKIPFAFYLTTHGDWGYSWDRYYFENNPLNNTLLMGGGVGIDIVTYYDFSLSVNYSINKIGDNELYLHIGI